MKRQYANDSSQLWKAWKLAKTNEDKAGIYDQIRRLTPGEYIAVRLEYLKELRSMKSVFVPGHSPAKLVERTNVRCEEKPEFNTSFVRVRILTGSARGLEVWACEGSEVYRAHSMP